jgi:hypothetical protein
MDIVFRLYFDLRSDEQLQGYAEVVRNAISQGGTYRRHNDTKYRTALIDAFEREKTEYTIKYPEEHVMELEQALQ